MLNQLLSLKSEVAELNRGLGSGPWSLVWVLLLLIFARRFLSTAHYPLLPHPQLKFRVPHSLFRIPPYPAAPGLATRPSSTSIFSSRSISASLARNALMFNLAGTEIAASMRKIGVPLIGAR
jgi:hypothetical protein